MYRNQTRAEMTRDALLVALLPALVMGGILVTLFSLVGQEYAPNSPLPWGFIGLAVGLTLLAGVGTAVMQFLGGPAHVRLTPAQEAAKKAQIRADVEARMSKYAVDPFVDGFKAAHEAV